MNYRLLKKQLYSSIRSRILSNRIGKRLIKNQFFGLNDIDKQLATIIKKSDGYFVELGANDGVSQSNTFHFEIYRNWRGVLIEPHPRTFQQLVKNRSNENRFFNVACVGFNFSKSKATLAFSDLMTVNLDGLSNIEQRTQHAVSGEQFWDGKTFLFESDALPLSTVLSQAGSPRQIDLLSLDVEGGEVEVLGGIDFEIYKFRYICIETRDLKWVSDLLASHGYVLHSPLSQHDFLFTSISE